MNGTFQNLVVRLEFRYFELLSAVGHITSISQIKGLADCQCDVGSELIRNENIAIVRLLRRASHAPNRGRRRCVNAGCVTVGERLNGCSSFCNETEKLFHALLIRTVTNFMKWKLVQNVVRFGLLKRMRSKSL